MKRPTRVFARLMLAWSLNYAPLALALKLGVEIDQGRVVATVDHIQYPSAVLEKSLVSGLPNDISLVLALSFKGEKKLVVTRNFQITYDLWDENYRMLIQDNAIETVVQMIDRTEVLHQRIKRIRINSAKLYTLLEKGIRYQLSAQVLVNPVKTEQIKKIRAWIATSQGFRADSEQDQHRRIQTPRLGGLPAGGPAQNSPATLGFSGSGVARPRFQKLFDIILEQHMNAEEIPALWRSETAVSVIGLELP